VLADDVREHGTARFLQDITDLGGLRPFDVDRRPGAPTERLRGEFQTIVEGFRQQGLFGARSIFRTNGLALDDLLDQLKQNGRYPELRDERDLMDALDRAARHPDPAEEPLTAADVVDLIQRAGDVRAGERWWVGPDEIDDSLAASADEGDTSFDVDGLTGELQARLPGAEAARQVGKADTTFTAPQQASGDDFDLIGAETQAARARREQAESEQEPTLFGDDAETESPSDAKKATALAEAKRLVAEMKARHAKEDTDPSTLNQDPPDEAPQRPITTEDLKTMVAVLRGYIDGGVTDFAAAARQFHAEYGEGARALDRAFEQAWKRWTGEDRKVADAIAGSTSPNKAADVRDAAAASQDVAPDGDVAEASRASAKTPSAGGDTRPPRPPRRPGGGSQPSGGGNTPPLPEATGLTQDRPLNLRGVLPAIRALIHPEGLGADARGAAGTIRHESAISFRRLVVAQERLKDFGKALDRLSREDAVRYWDAAERGRSTGDPDFDAGNALLREVTDAYTRELIALDRLKAESVKQNYVGRFWSMEPQGVVDFLRRALGRRPLEGSKSFLKKRSWEHFAEGIRAIQDAQARVAAGSTDPGDARVAQMRPATYNYVESQLAKIAEMQRVIAAERMLRQEKAAGRAIKVLDAMGKTPPVDAEGEDWIRLGPDGDPAFTIYGPKTIAIREAYDAKLMADLHNFARSIGVQHVRKIALGGNRWGYAVGASHITTKVGGPEGVLMHEIGHILDEKYGLRAKWVNSPGMREELRTLADLREEGQRISPSRKRYLRKGAEKIANLVHAFIYVPERAKAVAPQAYWALHNLAKAHPELRPLLDLQKHGRSLRLEANRADMEIPGFPVVGHWYAPKAAAAVWANHLSRGMRGNPLYDAYSAASNASVQLLLGFSGFHFTTIAREALNSRLAQVIDALANRGSQIAPSAAARHFAAAPAAAAIDAVFGRRIMQEYREPGTHPELAQVIDGMLAGGYRGTAESEFWRGDRVERLKTAFSEALHAASNGRRLWGAAKLPVDALWAGIELTMKPLMGYYVPYLKTAATYRAVADALAKLPTDTSADAVHDVLSHIVKEMDYRYGQVVYDNHFVHRMVKDLAQAAFLAPGWTFGTLTLAGRGLHQIAQIPFRAADALHGAGGDAEAPDGQASPQRTEIPKELIGPSAAYWIGGVLALMFINGLISYLYTGAHPEGKDYFGYRDGTKDDDGNWNRHTLPGYEMHDIYSWSRHPVQTFENKLKPAIAFIARLAHNRNYFGDMYYDPEAGPLTQAAQVAKAAVNDLAEPLSIQNYQEAAHRDEGGVGEAARNFFGITPAKREFVRSPAQNKIADYLAREGHTSRTPQEVDDSAARRDLRQALRTGDTAAAAAARASGTLSVGQVRAAQREAHETYLERGFKELSMAHALTVYEIATPEERAVLRPLLMHKGALIKNAPPAQQADLWRQYRTAFGLPVGTAAR
jgi:hypothetical protein